MTYGPANRLAAYNGEPVSYDADGNMTIGPLGDNMAASFTCDARNRLTGAGGLTYNYDALDNRVKSPTPRVAQPGWWSTPARF